MKHTWLAGDSEILAGKWERTDGTTYCRWYWHAKRTTLTVVAGDLRERKVFELSDQVINIERLKELLPDMSKQLVERLRRNV